MKYQESDSLELKATLTDNLLKEIVAFLNVGGGTILVGVNDDGEPIGVTNIDTIMKSIAEIITSKIEPSPIEHVKVDLIFDEDKTIVRIQIINGVEPIYCIKKHGFSSSGCYQRVGTSCVPMNDEQIISRYSKRFINDDPLVNAKTNLTSLTFKTLKMLYVDKGYVLNDETYKDNLNLRKDENVYTLLGELVSEENRHSTIFVKFDGNDKTAVSQRSDYGHRSLLHTIDQVLNRLSSENQCITFTTVRPRQDVYLYDYDAVSEAALNALVHNDYTKGDPQISFFTDRIEILSHGGLSHSLTIDDFYRGISKPRSESLMRILSDLEYAEHTGHGVPTIVNKYGKEAFEITSNYIIVRIPFDRMVTRKTGLDKRASTSTKEKLNSKEGQLLVKLLENPKRTALELSIDMALSKRTIERYLSDLEEKQYIIRSGSKKTGQWLVIK